MQELRTLSDFEQESYPDKHAEEFTIASEGQHSQVNILSLALSMLLKKLFGALKSRD